MTSFASPNHDNNKHKVPVFVWIITLNILMVLCFAIVYYWIGQEPENFRGVQGRMSFLDSIYFSITTQTTLGYGDITPRTDQAKIFVVLQEMFFMMELMYLAVVIGK